MSGLWPTTHVDTMSQAPSATMAMLIPVIRSGMAVKQSASTAIASPMTRLCVTSEGWFAVKWSTQGETAQYRPSRKTGASAPAVVRRAPPPITRSWRARISSASGCPERSFPV
jgi:hypothetical protein